MPATGNTATRGKRKVLITALLLIGLMVGLAACRGFFGQAPIALLTYTLPTDTEVPVTIAFDISNSSDPDGAIVSYDLDYGDGNTDTGTDVTDVLSHKYITAGPFTVTLTVTDGDGRIGTDSKIIATIGPAMLTFASDRGGDYDIWRMHADGTEAGIVLNTAGDELFPDLIKGTRDKIAYAAEGIAWNIWTMTVNGTSTYQLTTQTASNQIQPSWSYQGTKIAYASNADATQTPSDTTWKIYTMVSTGAVDSGTVLSAITQTPSWAPVYSPTNANTLLYVSTAGNTGGTAIWKYDGSSATKLTPTTPDAKHYGDASPALTGITLNLPTGAGVSRPAWSPDGTKIAFSTDADGDINIYVMNADGSAPQTLEAYVNSLVTPTVSGITTTDDEFSPYWLEDESGLVFAREETTGYNIYRVSFDDGSVTNLTDSTTHSNVMPAAKR